MDGVRLHAWPEKRFVGPGSLRSLHQGPDGSHGNAAAGCAAFDLLNSLFPKRRTKCVIAWR